MLASSKRWALPSIISARKASWNSFVLWNSHASVVLRLFTTRHPCTLPPQVVTGALHRRVVKRYTAGCWAHLFSVAHMDFRNFLFYALG